MSRTGSPARKQADDFWPDDRRGPGRRARMLIGAAAVLAVLAAAALAFALLRPDGGGAGGAEQGGEVLPTVYTPALADKDTAKLGDRKTDPRALTEGEVFTQNTKSVAYRSYRLTLAKTHVSADCKAVTWGARLQQDLARYGCSQILRGAYVGADKRHAGQFIAINLAGRQGADQIIRDLNPRTAAGFVRPLEAPGAPGFGAGFSAAYSQAYGHYAVVAWVQRWGGAQPATLNEMIDVSLAVEKPGDFVWSRLEMLPGTRGQN